MSVIRRLGPDDAAAFVEIRQRALREDPEAFLSSPDEDLVKTPEQARERLAGPQSAPDNGIFGAFLESRLIGTVSFVRETWMKIRHKAVIWGVYVAPEARGLGLGRMMLDAAIAALKAVPGIERAHLSVSVAHSRTPGGSTPPRDSSAGAWSRARWRSGTAGSTRNTWS